MKKSFGMVAVVASVALASSVMANEKAKKTGATFVPAMELKWTEVPNMNGIQMAVAEGDPAKGPAHFFMKFPAGFSSPIHHHSSDHHVTVLSGTLTLSVDGKQMSMPSGSFFSFTHKTPHSTSCAAGAECVIVIDTHGKWDVVAEKTPSKT